VIKFAEGGVVGGRVACMLPEERRKLRTPEKNIAKELADSQFA
jgi:hypothetical protein